MIRFTFSVLLGAALGLELVVSTLLPPPFNFICFAAGVFFVVVIFRDWYLCDGERYLARALKATNFGVRERLLQQAVDAATTKSQRSTGGRRAWHLLTLSKVRRQQGLLREAQDAVDSGLLAISKISGEGDVRMALKYMDALLSHDSKNDSAAIAELERIVAVPLHDLTDYSRDMQLKSCELLIELLTKSGYESTIEAVQRRMYLLGD